MSSILSLVALSLGTREDVVGPTGFLASRESTSLWTAAFSDSSFLTAWAVFWKQSQTHRRDKPQEGKSEHGKNGVK